MNPRFLAFALVWFLSLSLARTVQCQWVDVKDANSGISCFEINELNDVFAGTGGGILYSSDGGSTWLDRNNGLSNTTVWALHADGPFLFAGTEGGIFVTTDEGMNWTSKNNGLIEGQFVNDAVYAFAQVGAALFAGTSPSGVYTSTDNGASWSTVNSGIDVPEINALATVGSSLFAGTMEGGVYRSRDNGSSWQQVNNGMTATQVNTLAVVFGELFAGTPSDGAFRSNDAGDSWIASNTGFASLKYVNGFGWDAEDVFAVKNDGIYVSSDNGSHWTQKNEGLSDLRIRAIIGNGDNVLAGGFIPTIWKRTLASLNASSVAVTTPSFSLPEACPNPFIHTTTLRFTSPESGYATVTIVNQLGAEVSRVYSGEIGAGEHSFVWDIPTRLPAGMYECVVRMNGRAQETGIIVQ